MRAAGGCSGGVVCAAGAGVGLDKRKGVLRGGLTQRGFRVGIYRKGAGAQRGIRPSARLGEYVLIPDGPGNLYFRILLRACAGLVAVGCCSGLSVSDNRRLILLRAGNNSVPSAFSMLSGI